MSCIIGILLSSHNLTSLILESRLTIKKCARLDKKINCKISLLHHALETNKLLEY